jgi:hypothetical protein
MQAQGTLRPLLSLRTHQSITEFPRTLEEIDGLSTGVLTRLLEELGEDTDGVPAAKRQRLKLSMGIYQTITQPS